MTKLMKVMGATAVAAAIAAGTSPVLAGGYQGKAKSVATESAASVDIVDTAVAAGSFKTLAAALQAAGLVETLKGAGPFTVFAPTDEAFAKLPEGTVEALLKDKEKLTKVLTYHVVPGRLLAADVVKAKEAKTAAGLVAPIDATDGVKVAGAKVVKTDILCANGVIHVIDSVMLP